MAYILDAFAYQTGLADVPEWPETESCWFRYTSESCGLLTRLGEQRFLLSWYLAAPEQIYITRLEPHGNRRLGDRNLFRDITDALQQLPGLAALDVLA